MVKEGGRGYKNGEGRKEKGGGEIRMVREGEKKRGWGGG